MFQGKAQRYGNPQKTMYLSMITRRQSLRRHNSDPFGKEKTMLPGSLKTRTGPKHHDELIIFSSENQ
jgi:hypothetical protein